VSIGLARVHAGQADFLAGEYKPWRMQKRHGSPVVAIKEILAGNCNSTPHPAILGATKACRTAKGAYIRVALAENRSFNL
jgi:hypothetical protein